MIDNIPLPDIKNPIDQAFWGGIRNNQLNIQYCKHCTKYWFPPRAICSQCHNDRLEWSQVSGKGRIWSFTIAHPPLLPAFAKLAPYVVVLIELSECSSLRMVGNILPLEGWNISEIQGHQLAINHPVKVDYLKISDAITLPCWRLI